MKSQRVRRLSVLTLLALVGCRAAPITAVRIPHGRSDGFTRVAVGTKITVNFPDLGQYSEEVRLKHVTLDGVPKGLRVVAIAGTHDYPASMVGASESGTAPMSNYRVPLTAVRLGPARSKDGLQVTYVMVSPGNWTTSGLTVTVVHGSDRSTFVLPLRITASSNPP